MKYAAALLAGATLLLGVSAQAAPIGGAQAVAEQVTTAPAAQKVWWRRWGYGPYRPWGYGYYRPYYGYGYGYGYGYRPYYGYGYGHRYWRHW